MIINIEAIINSEFNIVSNKFISKKLKYLYL